MEQPEAMTKIALLPVRKPATVNAVHHITPDQMTIRWDKKKNSPYWNEFFWFTQMSKVYIQRLYQSNLELFIFTIHHVSIFNP